jgi:Ca-activated chloride channel homolog
MYVSAQPLASLLCSPEGLPVPLMGVSVSGEVFGGQARIFVRQRYRNKEAKAIEAIYTFPLPSDAALAGFAMECEGRRLEGEVKEREEAFQAYDEAVSRGHGAALLDQERHNVFTASVGNLLPGEETVIEVTYVQRLGADEGALRLMIPTLVAPRYIPGKGEGDRTGHGGSDPTDRVPDADRITPKIGAVKYGLSVDILFDVGRDVTIESPSHEINVSAAGGGRRRVALRREGVALDRDLVILAAGVEGNTAGVAADRKKGEDGTFALTVVPDLFDKVRSAAQKDVVFVVDVSGSMAGDSIEQARSAMRLCLRHLAEGDRFQIIAFSNQFTMFESGLVPFNQRTLEMADRWVGGLHASGGTEMLEPLLAATAALRQIGPQRNRLIVLLTDGQVGNEAEIVERTMATAAGTRILTFGIGTNVSDLLIRDLARRSKGASEMIYPGERIDEKVTAQFARATAARVEDVSLRFTGVDAGELAPSEMQPLVDGEPWVVYGRYSEAGIGRAELRGTLQGETFFLEVPVELPGEAEREGLGALWAAARIRDLEDAEGALTGRRAESNKKRIVALSVEHRVASKYASFVVVEKRSGDRRATGQPEARPVPVHGPAGWDRGPGDALEGGAMMTRAGTVKPGMSVMGMTMGAPARPGMAAPAAMASPGPVARAQSASAPAQRYFSPAPPPMTPGPAGPPPGARAPSPPPAPPGSAGPPGAKASGPPPMAPGFAPQGARAPAPPPMAPGARASAPSAAPMAAASKGSGAPAQALGGAGGDPMALLERQLASGLWEGDDGTEEGRLIATAQALAACYAAQIDTAHPTFGAQIRKAVEAVCRAAGELAKKGGAERAIMAALAAAFLVASGKRLRAQVTATAHDSGVDGLRTFAAELSGAEAAKRKLGELGIR